MSDEEGQVGIFDTHEYAGELPSVEQKTSVQAARKATGGAGTVRRQVYRALAESGGMTDDELEVRLDMSHQSVSARRRELVLKGLAKDSGEVRQTRHGRSAIVWVAVPEDEAVPPARDDSQRRLAVAVVHRALINEEVPNAWAVAQRIVDALIDKVL